MKQSILFVDDDVNLLRALQRSLRPQRDGWEMVFVADSRAALALLASRNFDVVISDMHMPGLDGAQFLKSVECLSPSSLRVIMSGYSETASVFSSIGPAHLYLAKPCRAGAVAAVMERARRLRPVLGDARLRRVVAGLRNLPSPPDLYLRITGIMADDERSTNDVAKIVGEDIAMTATVLKITNSSYFGAGSRITTVSQAVRLLGLETIRTLALSHGLFRQRQDNPALAQSLDRLNGHSLALAKFASGLARDEGADEALQSDAYCAGLLSNVGALILLDADPGGFEAALATAGDADFEAAERAVLGASQAEIGAYLLGFWGFSEAVVEAVYYQLHPSDCDKASRTALTYLHLARVFGPPSPLLQKPPRARAILDEAYARRLALPMADAAASARHAGAER